MTPSPTSTTKPQAPTANVEIIRALLRSENFSEPIHSAAVPWSVRADDGANLAGGTMDRNARFRMLPPRTMHHGH